MKRSIQIAVLAMGMGSAQAAQLPVDLGTTLEKSINSGPPSTGQLVSTVSFATTILLGYAGANDSRSIFHSAPEFTFAVGQAVIGLDGVLRGTTEPDTAVNNVQASLLRAIDRTALQAESMSADPLGTVEANLHPVTMLLGMATVDPVQRLTTVTRLLKPVQTTLGVEGNPLGDLNSWEMPAAELSDLNAAEGLDVALEPVGSALEPLTTTLGSVLEPVTGPVGGILEPVTDSLLGGALEPVTRPLGL